MLTPFLRIKRLTAKRKVSIVEQGWCITVAYAQRPPRETSPSSSFPVVNNGALCLPIKSRFANALIQSESGHSNHEAFL
jgi:hypothetical protein